MVNQRELIEHDPPCPLGDSIVIVHSQDRPSIPLLKDPYSCTINLRRNQTTVKTSWREDLISVKFAKLFAKTSLRQVRHICQSITFVVADSGEFEEHTEDVDLHVLGS